MLHQSRRVSVVYLFLLQELSEFYSYDLDLPLEVDDEYWEVSNPAEAFQQPRDVPSKISALNCYIKIGWILGFVQKTLVSMDCDLLARPLNSSSTALTSLRPLFQKPAVERKKY